ncbi:putative lipid-binding protein AIR1 [Hibiscus syriacus]|uniref:putative lipid-binding protein AIR1 n=1 Tax=Hibiscus syriacus TaxID=106335 RepID=UPI001920C41E|nr:putative lipid-binding protein AIR1 [Hibiscus syriacus]
MVLAAEEAPRGLLEAMAAAGTVIVPTALILSINLLFFALVNSQNVVNNLKGYCATNSKNHVVIRPGDVVPNGLGQSGTCNPLNLGVYLVVLGLVNVELGDVPIKPCCSLIQGLADLEAAVCLCTTVKARVLGININLPISLSLVFSTFAAFNSAILQCFILLCVELAIVYLLYFIIPSPLGLCTVAH